METALIFIPLKKFYRTAIIKKGKQPEKKLGKKLNKKLFEENLNRL